MTKTIESLKNYIQEEVKEKGLDNNQIEIDFTDLFEDFSEFETAADQLGYSIQSGEGQGMYWIYLSENDKEKLDTITEEVERYINLNDEEKEALLQKTISEVEIWENEYKLDADIKAIVYQLATDFDLWYEAI